MLVGDVSDVPPVTTIVAAGTPRNTMFPAVVDDTLVVESNVMAKEITAFPKRMFSLVDVKFTPEVVIVLVPSAGPAIESPNPDEVIVDDTTVSPIAEMDEP